VSRKTEQQYWQQVILHVTAGISTTVRAGTKASYKNDTKTALSILRQSELTLTCVIPCGLVVAAFDMGCTP